MCMAGLQKDCSLGQDGTTFCHSSSFPPFLYSLYHLVTFPEGEDTLFSFISVVDRCYSPHIPSHGFNLNQASPGKVEENPDGWM